MFVLRDASTIETPSSILSENDQIDRIRAAGLAVEEVAGVGVDVLAPPVSPKVAGFDGPIVTAFLARVKPS